MGTEQLLPPAGPLLPPKGQSRGADEGCHVTLHSNHPRGEGRSEAERQGRDLANHTPLKWGNAGSVPLYVPLMGILSHPLCHRPHLSQY